MKLSVNFFLLAIFGIAIVCGHHYSRDRPRKYCLSHDVLGRIEERNRERLQQLDERNLERLQQLDERNLERLQQLEDRRENREANFYRRFEDDQNINNPGPSVLIPIVAPMIIRQECPPTNDACCLPPSQHC